MERKEEPIFDKEHSPFLEMLKKRERLIVKHNKLCESKEFKDELVYLHRITMEFLQCVCAVGFMSTRHTSLRDDLLIIRGLDDYTESGIAIEFLIREGCHNPARREIRYMLESAVKYLYVDQSLPSSEYKDKLAFLKNEVPRSGIDIVDDIKLSAFEESTQTKFTNDLKNFYSKTCAYVHPSEKQRNEREQRIFRGAGLGFETPKEIRPMRKLCFCIYDIVMVILLHGIGLAFAGDFFINIVDESPKYRMLKGKYLSKLSRYFDYKQELKT